MEARKSFGRDRGHIRSCAWAAQLARALGTATLVAVLTGCAATKLYKEGVELEQGGKSYAAAQKYLAALDKDAKHKDSKAALAAVAEAAYNEKLGLAQQYETGGRFPAALKEYQELSTFMTRVQKDGPVSFAVIDLDAKVDELGNMAAEEEYQSGQRFLAERNCESALQAFSKAHGFKAGYKDTAELIPQSHYQCAEIELSQRHFRAAAERFRKADEAYGSPFKDARGRAGAIYVALGRYFVAKDVCRQAVRDLRTARELVPSDAVEAAVREAQECAVTPVAILSFENPTGRSIGGMALGDVISDTVNGKLRGKASEFVKLIEREALDQVLQESRISADKAASGKVTKLRGVRFLVLGKLTQVRLDDQPDQTSTKGMTGKENYSCTQTTRDGKSYNSTCSRDIPVQYTLHEAKRTVRIGGSVKVVDTKTGEQLASIPLDVIADDAIAYTDGFKRTDNYQPYDISHHPTNLLGDNTPKQLAEGRTSLKDEAELTSAVIDVLSNKAAEAVLGAVDKEKQATDPSDLKLEPVG